MQRVTELTYFLLVPKDSHVFVQTFPLLPGEGRRSLEDSPQRKASGSPQGTRFNTRVSEQDRTQQSDTPTHHTFEHATGLQPPMSLALSAFGEMILTIR